MTNKRRSTVSKTDLPTSGPLAPGIRVGVSKIDGLGCFALVPFAKRRKVAEYAGERISRREIKRRLKGQTKIQICAIDSYWAVDGSVGGNGTQYINHSCTPNIYIKVVNGRLLFFALRDIKPGEELTLDYVDSYHSDQKRCRCGASTCRRTINLIEQNGHRR